MKRGESAKKGAPGKTEIAGSGHLHKAVAPTTTASARQDADRVLWPISRHRKEGGFQCLAAIVSGKVANERPIIITTTSAATSLLQHAGQPGTGTSRPSRVSRHRRSKGCLKVLLFLLLAPWPLLVPQSILPPLRLLRQRRRATSVGSSATDLSRSGKRSPTATRRHYRSQLASASISGANSSQL